ncbi:MAG: VCBS repeat-containing protein, partial [Candidatus Dadabacteria bacterium]|nr:VCBS repeat-containing protein [Candidatus Dadabacteria bacterium]
MLLIVFVLLTGVDARSEDGVPRFTDVKSKTGVKTPQALGQTSAWGDYNNDGWLDLLISDIARRSPGRGSRVRSYSSRRGYQEQAPEQEAEESKPLQLLYLYSGRDGKTFAEVSESVGLPNMGVNSAAWADYNNDGYLDL